MKNKHREIYLNFLDLEIPNIIQIFGIVSLLSFLFQNFYLVLIVVLVSGYLFNRYFFAKFFEYLKEQLVDPHSETNRYKLRPIEPKNDYGLYIHITSLTFSTLNLSVACGIMFVS